MRRKFCTLLDEHLYNRARFEANRQGKQVADLVGEALAQYLDGRAVPGGRKGAVTESWGVIRLPGGQARQLLRDEEGLLEG